MACWLAGGNPHGYTVGGLSCAGDRAVEAASEEAPRCPQSVASMDLESQQQRPPWRELFYGPDHPAWIEGVGSG